MATEKGNQMNYNSSKYDNLHGRLHALILDMQDELDDFSVRLEELRAMVALAEAQKDTLEGIEYSEEQLRELRSMIDDVAAASAKRARNTGVAPSYIDEEAAQAAEKKKKKKTLIGNIVFYGVLAAFVLGVFIVSLSSGNGVKTFMGHAAFIVKTSSMESVYPRGSLVITKVVDPDILQVGDDITFMANQTSTITHRIITIHENYGDTSYRGFETQGVMNDEPDKNIVLENNVVGKVVYCSAFIGAAASFVTKNWPILVFSIAVIIGLSMVLENIFKEDDKKQEKQPKRKKKFALKDIDDDDDLYDDDDDIDLFD